MPYSLRLIPQKHYWQTDMQVPWFIFLYLLGLFFPEWDFLKKGPSVCLSIFVMFIWRNMYF